MTTVFTCDRDGKEIKYRKGEGKNYWLEGDEAKETTITHLLRTPYTLKDPIHPKGSHTL
jgi:hypothetical protein